MRIVIAGCGRVGQSVATALVSNGDDVSVIDEDPTAREELGTFDGTFHVGSAFDLDVLEAAGIRDADAFLAVTNSDNANLMAAQIAQNVYGKRAIARLDDPERAEVYRTLGVDHVTGAQLIANVVVEMVREPDFAYHLSFPAGSPQIIEMTISPRGQGLPVADLEIEGRLRVAAVNRGGRVFIPSDDTTLVPGDVVVAAARRGALSRVRRYVEGSVRRP